MSPKSPRPLAAPGFTIERRSSCGKIYTTATISPTTAAPLEVFIRFGKAGGCGSAMADGIARLVSYALRSGLEARDAFKALSGIGCHLGSLPTFHIDAPKTVTIKGRAPGHPAVPPADQQYIFRQATLSDLFTWYLLGERSLYLTGPTGCGKSSVIIEVAARLNIPLWNVVAHSRLETPELIGGYRLNTGGGMDFVPGPLLTAMKEGG